MESDLEQQLTMVVGAILVDQEDFFGIMIRYIEKLWVELRLARYHLNRL